MSTFEEDQTGKIGNEAFNEILLPRCGLAREEVLTGPGYGVDTSVIDLGDGRGLAISSDPLSLIPSLGLQESAWLSVHLLANDMATTGFAPMYAQFVLNLPVSVTRADFREYWDHIHRFCRDMDVAITGGHTGQIEGQNSTISGGGTMFLTAPIDRILTSKSGEPGDRLLVTKEAALLSTSILAMSFPETVQRKIGKKRWQVACDNFYRTSSLPDVLVATGHPENRKGLKAMHDVTEGGILGAVSELADASGCGFSVCADDIPVCEAVESVAKLFEIDPLLSVGAGSMIMAVNPDMEPELVDHLRQYGIPAAAIGSLTENEEGRTVITGGEPGPFRFDGQDPYWGAFFKALNAGWK